MELSERRNRLLIASYLFWVISANGFLQPFLPLYVEAKGLNRFDLGMIIGGATAAALIVQPVLGRWSDIVDARRPFICGAGVVAFLAYSLFPLAHTLPQFLLLTAIGTNGAAYMGAAGAVLVGRMVASSSGGAGYANLRAWGSVGYIVTSLLSGQFVAMQQHGRPERVVLDPIFHIGPVIFLAVAALAWFLPDRKSVTQAIKKDRAPLPRTLKIFLVSYFIYTFGLYGSSSFLSIFMSSLGSSGRWITLAFSAGVFMEVVVMRWAGGFSDRFGRRPALAIAYLVLPLRLWLYVPATGPVWLLLVQMLHGLNFGIVGTVGVAFVNDLATERTRGQAQARLAAVAGLAMAVAPLVMGAISQLIGLRLMYGVAGIIAAAGCAVFLLGVHDSHGGAEALADHLPRWCRRFVRLLDEPPSSVPSAKAE